MSITSLSCTATADYHRRSEAGAGRLALPAERSPRRTEDDARPASAPAEAPGQGRNPLVAAMLQAVQGLVGTTAAAASVSAVPASPVNGSTNSKTSTETSASVTADASALKDAAVAFAHELFGAISEFGSRAVAHHDHGRHRGHAYGNLALRLDTLAARLEAGATNPVAAPAPAPDTAPLSVPAAEDDAAGTSTPTATATVSTPSADKTSSLVSAFDQFVRALNPAAAQATAGTGSSSQKLASFLRSIAQSLRAGPAAAQAAVPAAGSLVNLSV